MGKSLRAVQEHFLAAVIGSDAEAERLIVDDERVGARRRLDIYRNNYRAALAGVLAEHFERLHAYVGDDQFDQLASAYIAAHPSGTRNLRYYGGDFSAFLARHYPDDGELAELAALDWALRHAFDAADWTPLDARQVGAMGDAWIERHLVLHPAARMVAARHNVAAIWSALDREEAPPAAERLALPTSLLVWRHDGRQRFRSLGQNEAAALALLAAGCSFTELSTQTLDRMDEDRAMQTLAAWLAEWLAEGVLCIAGQ